VTALDAFGTPAVQSAASLQLPVPSFQLSGVVVNGLAAEGRRDGKWLA